MICGGIDWATKDRLEKYGIHVLDNTTGEVEEILTHLPSIARALKKEEKTKARKKLRPGKEKGRREPRKKSFA